MLYSGYLFLYILQFLNLEICQTQLVQPEPHTTTDLIEDTLFPENGPVFMQKLRRLRDEVHPVRKSGDKIKRRFDDTLTPATKSIIETLNERLIHHPEYANSYPAAETPIQNLYQSTVLAKFDNANPYNNGAIQGHNEALINAYNDYHAAIEATVQKPYQSTPILPKFDNANPYMKGAFQGQNEALINQYNEYHAAEETTDQKLYQSSFLPNIDNANPYNKDNPIQGHEPFRNEYNDYHIAIETTVQNIDDIRNDITKVMKNIHDLNPLVTETNILTEPNDLNHPMMPKMSDDYSSRQKSPTQGLDYPLMDGPAYPKLFDEVSPISTDKNNLRYNEPLYEPTFTPQNLDVTKTQTAKKIYLNKTMIKKIADTFYPTELETTERSRRTRMSAGGLFFIQRSRSTKPKSSQTTIQKMHAALKVIPAFVPKSDATKKETTIRILHKPLLNDVSFSQKEQRNPKRNTTKRSNEPLINRPDIIQHHGDNIPKTESEITRTATKNRSKTSTRKTTMQRFDEPLKHASEFEPKANQDNYPPALKSTDFIQNYDLNSLPTETATQIFSGSGKHKPKSKNVRTVTYPQNSEKTSPTIKQIFEVSIPPKVQRISRTPFTNPPLKSFVNSKSNSNPSFSSNLASKATPELTNMELASPVEIGPTVTHIKPPPIDDGGHIYPWMKTTHLPRTNLASTVSYSTDDTGLMYPWAPESTPESPDVPATILTHEYHDPEILRARVWEPTQLKQKSYTIITEPTQDKVLAESLALIARLKPKQDYQALEELLRPKEDNQEFDETLKPKKAYQALAETLRSKVDDQVLEERLKSKQDYPTLEERNKPKQDDQALEERLTPKHDYQAREERNKPNEDNKALEERLKPRQEYQALAKRLESKQVQVPVPELPDVEGEGTDPFSTFLRKLMKVLASKSFRDLRNLLQPFERYVTVLVDSGKLMKLGIATGSFIAQSTPLLHGSVKEIQKYLFIGQISLENRRRMLDDSTNAMLYEMDDVYDVSEEEAMQRVLNEITNYPNTSRSEEEIIRDFVDDIFLHPMHRVAGTSKGNVVFESIGKFANKYISAFARRNERHEEYVDPLLISENLVNDFRKFNEAKTRGTKRKEETMILDSSLSDNRSYESIYDKNGVEIQIRINGEKSKAVMSRRNADKLLKDNLKKKDKKDVKKNKEKINKECASAENSESESIKEEFKLSKTEEKNRVKINRKNKTNVKVQLDCKALPIIMSDKGMNKKDSNGKPLTEMIMFCSNDNAPNGSNTENNSA